MRPVKTLRVLANPWLHIHVYADDIARPAGNVGVDMVEHVPAPNRYVGARIAEARLVRPGSTMRVGASAAVRTRPRHELVWAYETEPVVIPNTGYYRDQLKAGTLIAADAETASAAGLKFAQPAEALAKAKAIAVAAFEAANGKGVFEIAEPLTEAEARAAQAPTEPSKTEPASDPAGHPAPDRSPRKSRSKDSTP